MLKKIISIAVIVASWATISASHSTEELRNLERRLTAIEQALGSQSSNTLGSVLNAPTGIQMRIFIDPNRKSNGAFHVDTGLLEELVATDLKDPYPFNYGRYMSVAAVAERRSEVAGILWKGRIALLEPGLYHFSHVMDQTYNSFGITKQRCATWASVAGVRSDVMLASFQGNKKPIKHEFEVQIIEGGLHELEVWQSCETSGRNHDVKRHSTTSSPIKYREPNRAGYKPLAPQQIFLSSKE